MTISTAIKNEFPKVELSTWKELVASQMKLEDVTKEIVFNSVEEVDYNYLNLQSVKTLHLASFPAKTNISFFIAKEEFTKSIESIAQSLELKSFYKANADIKASSLHNAGASAVLEITYALEEFSKLCADTSKTNISIELAMDSQTYLGIAKLRALRFMLEKFIAQNNLSTKFQIIATSSLREQSIFDPWMNMLRGVSSLTSALIGGADEYALTSFDHAFSLANDRAPMDLAIRNAVNMAHVLVEESRLSLVKDASKGSYAMDNLTHDLISNAQAKLITTEKTKVDYKAECLESLRTREELLDKRKYIMSGINDFVNLSEDLVAIYKADQIDLTIKSETEFPVVRLSEKFEQLRFAVSLKQESIDLLIYPNVKKLSSRLNFCKNYFETAGLNINLIECSSLDEIQTMSDYVCLCANDEDLEALVLKENFSSKKRVFISGNKVKKETFINIFQGQNIFEQLSFFKGDIS